MRDSMMTCIWSLIAALFLVRQFVVAVLPKPQAAAEALAVN